MLDIFLTFFQTYFTLENWLSFVAGIVFCRFWYRKEISQFTCHSCHKGRYIFDPKRVRNDPFLFVQNRKNGYVCNQCGKSAPYNWHP